MARRRRGVGARLMAGLGEGLANLGPMMLRQQQMDRMDERAAKSQQAILDRQQTMARESAAREILKEVAEGADPQSAVARLSALGINLEPSALEQVRPTPQRRMLPTVDKINAATDYAGVLPEESVLQAGRKENLFDAQFAGPMLEGEEGMAGFDPAVRDTVKTAGARRRSFLDAPEKVTRTNPATGQSEMLTTSLGQLQNEPLAMGPTPEQQGVFKGIEEGATITQVGPQRAAQKGAEAKATLDVEQSPEAQAARTREAVNREVATLKATLPMQLELATKKAAIEVQQAVNKENAANVSASARASGDLSRFFTKVADLTRDLNDQEFGPSARAQGAIATAGSYVGMEPRIQELEQLIAQNARQLAIAMGVREANVSEKETVQALKGIGLSQWSTGTERRNALRNLQDLITISPAIAARSTANASVGERMSLGQNLMRARRAAEQEAIKAGFSVYLDPVTGAPTKVIQ